MSRADLLSPAEAATRLGVSIDTVRRWVSDGRLTEHRTQGGHRRLDAAEVAALAGPTESRTGDHRRASKRRSRGVVGYARAHPGDDRDAVLRPQRERLVEYGCDEVITEIASSFADIRPGLAELLQWVATGEVGEVVVVTQDRVGANSAFLFAQCLAAFDARLTILEPSHADGMTRGELIAELRSIVAAQTSRLFGAGDPRSTALCDALDAKLSELTGALTAAENATGTRGDGRRER